MQSNTASSGLGSTLTRDIPYRSPCVEQALAKLSQRLNEAKQIAERRTGWDEGGNVIETHEHAGDFKEGCVWDMDNEAERLKDFERQHRDLSDARIEEEKEKYLPDFPERKILNRILDERGTQREKAARIALLAFPLPARWRRGLARWPRGRWYWFHGVRIRIIAPNHPLCPQRHQ